MTTVGNLVENNDIATFLFSHHQLSRCSFQNPHKMKTFPWGIATCIISWGQTTYSYKDRQISVAWNLTHILLPWRIWWAPNNARKWQMGFNSALKGLNNVDVGVTPIYGTCTQNWQCIWRKNQISSNIKLVNIALHHWKPYPHYQSVALPSSHLTYIFFVPLISKYICTAYCSAHISHIFNKVTILFTER
jgi:hypothetical protein